MTDTNTENVTAAEDLTGWKKVLRTSEGKRVAGQKSSKQAGELLWKGAQQAIEDWMPESDDDVSAERLYNEVQDALGGKHRKGDANKIKNVAIAVKSHGLVPSVYKNLSQAYKEAKRLTTTVQQERAEDEAAEKAIEGIEAPKTASTPENAALVVLAQGVDEAARLLLDALGKDNNAAHRALMRAISQEVAGRVQAAKPKPKPKAGPKAGAKQAKKGASVAKPKAEIAKPKAKPVQSDDTKPEAAAPKAKPVQKGKPVKRAVPVKRAAK